MVLLPDAQPELDPVVEGNECLVRVNEAEFLALIDNLLAAIQEPNAGV